MKAKQLFKCIVALALSLLTVLMLSAPIASAVAPEDTNLLGDINDDGDIDQYDYILAKRIHFKNYTPTAEQAERGDVDKDDDNDQYDYILIKRHHFGNYVIVQEEPDTGDPIVVENGLYINMPQSGTLKIAQFADLHYGTEGKPYQNDKVARTMKYMQYIVESQSPDLIVCSGDNIMSTGVDALKEFVAFMDSLKTPWTFIFGNHDAESNATGFSKKDLSDYLESCDSPYLLYSAGYVEEDNNRYGNFSISVLNKSGTKLLGAIMLFDAGTYSASLASYESITKGQIDWYKTEINKLNEQYSGDKMLPSIVFSHIQLPEFYDAYVAAQKGDGAEFVIKQELSSYEINEIKSGGPTNENTGFYDVLVEEGSTKAYFVGHAHTYNFQVLMNGITLGFGPQTGFSTLFANNDLPRTTYIYNIKSDFSFTTDVAVEPSDDLGLTYLGTYDGSAAYNDADGTYNAELAMNAGNSLMFAYNGVRLTSSSMTVTGDFASDLANAGGTKMYFSDSKTLKYSGAKARKFNFSFNPETMTLNITSTEIEADPDAPTSITAAKVNTDAGADAVAVWTQAGTKLYEVTDISDGTGAWIGNGWRYYVVIDAEGRIAYAVLHPLSGYGGPNGTGYYCNSYYTDYTKNPAITLLDGYANDWATGGFGYKLYEIAVPEGGFAITSHGTTNNELYDMFSQGTLENYDISNINTRSVYDSNIRVHYDAETQTISVTTVE